MYFGIRNSFLKTKVDPDFSTLGVISRPVVEVLLRMSDRDRWLRFRPAVRRLSFSEGYEGTRSYTLSKLTRGGRPMVDEDDFYVVPARDDRAKTIGTLGRKSGLSAYRYDDRSPHQPPRRINLLNHSRVCQ